MGKFIILVMWPLTIDNSININCARIYSLFSKTISY